MDCVFQGAQSFSLDVCSAFRAKKGIDDMNAKSIEGKIAFITGAPKE